MKNKIIYAHKRKNASEKNEFEIILIKIVLLRKNI